MLDVRYGYSSDQSLSKHKQKQEKGVAGEIKQHQDEQI